MKSCLFVLVLTLAGLAYGQAPRTASSGEILHAMKKLKVVGSVLYVAAHPDDENTRLLAYLSNELRLRTGYLSITRGDGGQNLIGKEQGKLLGIIRTQELMAARRIDGAEQFFTRANDFGYSKNPEETFQFWNKDSILADVVWTIRHFRPDVIICRFPTTGEGGHGHHTASAILALEAFEAAADSNRFREQLAFVPVWKTSRIFWNTFNFGSTNTTAPNQLKLDVGVFNPLLGKGYGEIASESRSMHKSQGFGAARTRGETMEYFRQWKGDSVKENPFENLELGWNRIPGSQSIQSEIEKCIAGFKPHQPESSIPSLLEIRRMLNTLNGSNPLIKHWKELKLQSVETLIYDCLGLWCEAAATGHTGMPGEPVEFNAQIITRNPYEIKLKKIRWLNGQDSLMGLILKHNKLNSFRHKEVLPRSTPFSNPFWLNKRSDSGRFRVDLQQQRDQPVNDPGPSVEFLVEAGGQEFRIVRPLIYKFTDPVKGEVYRPFEVLPPATINCTEPFLLFKNPGEKKKVQFRIRAYRDSLSGVLELSAPEGWEIHLTGDAFLLIRKNDEIIMEATVTCKTTGGGKLMAGIRIKDEPFTKGIVRIDYDHIPSQFLLEESEVALISMDLKTGGKTIGYIPGAGDETVNCLRQAGFTVTVLTDEMIGSGSLQSYSAIITGIRAFNTNDRLIQLQNKLLDYVKNGGNLIVQYNTNSRVGPLKTSLGPYPFTISRQRVTDETAEVRFLKPDHPVLNYPNKISPSDFDGWVQERGIYFAEELDPKYSTILAWNDAGEKSLEGSLIIGALGKGNFVYTGIAFFRQLPAGVPGSFRLLANLLALPQNK